MSLVIATAGHVDHGKSTLVRALTGTDPDRLTSEKERGLTIELGFAWADVEGMPVAFVDVPGHERFISTTLSGVGSVPVVLFVAAADDPWMPQSAEHLAALDALGVHRGVIAVTRSDLADPGPAVARVHEELAHTHLAGAPIIPVSAVTGAGMDLLREEIARIARAVPAPDPASDVRVWVDRRFTIAGAGTVVTATLSAGTLRVGEELQGPTGMVRIRGLQSRSSSVPEVNGPARVALNLTGAADGLTRGTPLWSANHWRISDRVDVRLVTQGAASPPRTPMLHVGAHSSLVQLRTVDSHHAQILLDDPLPWRQGDRLILRDPGNRELWGAVVLDPSASPIRGSSARAERSAQLTARGETPDYAAELAERGIASRSDLRSLGHREAETAAWHMDPHWARTITTRLRELVTSHDRSHPANPGLFAAEIIRSLGLPAELPATEFAKLIPAELTVRDGRVTSRALELPQRVEQALAELRQGWVRSPFEAPTLEDLRALGLSEQDLGAAARAKRIFLPAPGVVLPPTAPTRAVELLRGLPKVFTTSEARRVLGTSRRVTIPILEFLDRARITRRLPDNRRELLPGSGEPRSR